MHEQDPMPDVPRSDGRFHNLVRVAAAGGPRFDASHTDQLDNFTAMEVTLKSRCHGHPLEAMAYPITPIGMHYLLIHYDVPVLDAADHRLLVEGLVERQLSLNLDDLKRRPRVTIPVTLECCGNGRMSMRNRLWPHVPWNHEAIGNAEWTGTPLRGVLEEAGIRPGAVDVVFTGLDKGIQGGQVQHFQRSLTVEHALSDEVLLAYEINGQPLPPQHGHPLRLIVPGWLGMASVKWLGSIELIDRKFTGSQMRWYSTAVSDDDPEFVPCTHNKVRSLMIPPGVPDFFSRFRWLEEADRIELRGRAWVGGGIGLRSVEVSLDGGSSWCFADLEPSPGPFAWSGWSFTWRDVRPGRYTLLTRATDAEGRGQDPDDTWNYYAMDHTKPQAIDVEVLPKGALEPGAFVSTPSRYPTL